MLRNATVGADFSLCPVALGSEKAAQHPPLTHQSKCSAVFWIK